MPDFNVRLKVGDREYTVLSEGHPDAELAEFIWTDGNYACDCNRSLFLNRQHGLKLGVLKDGGYELPCGDTIELLGIEPVGCAQSDDREVGRPAAPPETPHTRGSFGAEPTIGIRYLREWDIAAHRSAALAYPELSDPHRPAFLPIGEMR